MAPLVASVRRARRPSQ